MLVLRLLKDENLDLATSVFVMPVNLRNSQVRIGYQRHRI